MFKTWSTSFASLALAMNAVPAHARDWGTVSGWFVSSSGETCGMFGQNQSAKATEVVILKRRDGAFFLQVKNANWLRSSGELSFLIDGVPSDGPFSINAIDKGYVAAFGESFERALQGGTTLTVTLGAIVLDQISLAGSAAALATVQSCLDDVRSVGKASKIVKSPRPTNASSWISDTDYPDGALRDRREGTAGFRLSVGANGRAKDCVITSSSGSADLDSATCSNILKRARFSPAEDASGTAVDASYSSRVSWNLPDKQ